MKISDIMTCSVLSVEPATPVLQIARFLVDHGISAVPVVEDGQPVGIVSETDLVMRAGTAKSRESGWLAALLHAPAHIALDGVFRQDMTARDVMTSPAVVVNADAALDDVLNIMVTRSVKRLPVLDKGRLCGIISRADVLRALAKPHGRRPGSMALYATRHQQSVQHAQGATQESPAVACPMPGESGEEVISAAALRYAVETYRDRQAQSMKVERSHLKEELDREIAAFLDQELTADFWRDMLLRARAAAERGAVEIEALHFPCGVCSDAGRAINNGEDGWAVTLRGLPAAIWQRWNEELHGKGFRMKARILDFPGGVPGHVGLFLSWSKF